MAKDSTTTNILRGNGLKPLQSTSTTALPSGVTTEQKGSTPSGVRKDIFTLHTAKSNTTKKK